jgi:hypothetical protein
MERQMNGPTEAAGFAFFKLYGLKVGLGMIGAALLFFVLPPIRKDGSFDQKEFVARLAVAGVFSVVFGDWAIAVVMAKWPWLMVSEHSAPMYLLVGAPGWWISRAVALWFQKRRDKDIAEIVQDVKERV